MEAAGSAIDRVLARESARTSMVLLLSLALAKLLIQFAGINHYGFFRDELYYMACGEHLAWGYIDQPPLIALIAWFARHAFGDSLFAVRLLPSLACLLLFPVLLPVTSTAAITATGASFSHSLILSFSHSLILSLVVQEGRSLSLLHVLPNDFFSSSDINE